MSTRRIWIGLAGFVLILAGAFWLLAQRAKTGPATVAAPAAQPSVPTQGSETRPGAGPIAARVEEPSHLADGLNSPAGNVHSDLRLLNEIFIAYRGAIHSGNPVGENSEITAALTGHNRLGFAFVPSDCAAINSKGELCDRWGKPYFFHQISGERMEIRSAGPDSRLWTSDDEVLTP
jgi:hypothetical protein